jgi:hypothetical protein
MSIRRKMVQEDGTSSGEKIELTSQTGSYGNRGERPQRKEDSGSKGPGLSERLLNNPAVIGGLLAGLLIFLTTLGLTEDQAQQVVDLVVLFLVDLGIGGAVGWGVRGVVKPVRKR